MTGRYPYSGLVTFAHGSTSFEKLHSLDDGITVEWSNFGVWTHIEWDVLEFVSSMCLYGLIEGLNAEVGGGIGVFLSLRARLVVWL
jgi:hypothetical protein